MKCVPYFLGKIKKKKRVIFRLLPAAVLTGTLTLLVLQFEELGWLDEAKVSCSLHHRGVQLILAYIWARPAIPAASKGGGGMFFFLLFRHWHSFAFSPVPLFFISSTVSSISLLPFSGRQHKMTHKGWCVVKPQHSQYFEEFQIYPKYLDTSTPHHTCFNKYNLLPNVVSKNCHMSGKQGRPWWDAAFCSISSGCTLFAQAWLPNTYWNMVYFVASFQWNWRTLGV